MYKKVKGDFTATGNFDFLVATGNSHRKIGRMLRQYTDDKSIAISALEHGHGLTVMQWRRATGENVKDPEGQIFYPKKTFEVV